MTDMKPLALTLGEPAGIGPELTFKAWTERRDLKRPFYVTAPEELLRQLAQGLGYDIPLSIITHPMEAAAVFETALPVFALPVFALPEPDGIVTPGHPTPDTGAAVIASIEQAVRHVQKGFTAGVVTNPIQKSVLYDAGFRHPGHTEYLASLCAQSGTEPLPVMMLAIPELRVVPLTVHIPLKNVPDSLTADHVVNVATITAHALIRDFGIKAPRIALAGLNPHAGEDGRIGDEEQRIFSPAITRLREMGIEIIGPLSADAMFHKKARAQYDVALCGYHDQALIPLKTIDFDRGVNITLGLPIIRTSPDHGTALDLAGKNIASVESLKAALHMAHQMAISRAL